MGTCGPAADAELAASAGRPSQHLLHPTHLTWPSCSISVHTPHSCRALCTHICLPASSHVQAPPGHNDALPLLQGALLVDQSEKLDSLNLLRYMAPMALVLMLPAALILEPGVFQQVLTRARSDTYFLMLLLANATLAYLVNLLNFLVTRFASALALQVLGNAKGVAAVSVSIMVFRNPVSLRASIGYAITLASVGLFFASKRLKPAKISKAQTGMLCQTP